MRDEGKKSTALDSGSREVDEDLHLALAELFASPGGSPDRLAWEATRRHLGLLGLLATVPGFVFALESMPGGLSWNPFVALTILLLMPALVIAIPGLHLRRGQPASLTELVRELGSRLPGAAWLAFLHLLVWVAGAVVLHDVTGASGMLPGWIYGVLVLWSWAHVSFCYLFLGEPALPAMRRGYASWIGALLHPLRSLRESLEAGLLGGLVQAVWVGAVLTVGVFVTVGLTQVLLPAALASAVQSMVIGAGLFFLPFQLLLGWAYRYTYLEVRRRAALPEGAAAPAEDPRDGAGDGPPSDPVSGGGAGYNARG